jgi:hypothetical protein
MAAPSNVFWDPAGHLHTNALHWEGFPRLLWESLRTFLYIEAPQYDAVEYQEEGVHRLEAIYLFCNQHPREVPGRPIGIFSTTDPNDPEWNLRVVPEGHKLQGSTKEALRGTLWFMKVQHHYQLLLRHEMGQLINTA